MLRLHLRETKPPADVQPLLGALTAAMAVHVHVSELLERAVLTTDNDDLMEGIDVVDARVVVAVAVVLTTSAGGTRLW